MRYGGVRHLGALRQPIRQPKFLGRVCIWAFEPRVSEFVRIEEA
jgi:hypothetical protein